MRHLGLRRTMAVVSLLAVAAVALPNTAGAQQGEFEEKRRRCFEPRHRNHSVRIHCFQLYKLEGDGNNRRDYWALHHYGTARSKDGYALTMFRLRAFPHPDGPRIRQWSDWAPRQDMERGRCDSVSIGVSAFGASMSWSHQLCEEWDIKFFPDRPGRFHNSWKTGPTPVEDSEREVAYAMVVAVKQGQQPRWSFRGFTKTQ